MSIHVKSVASVFVLCVSIAPVTPVVVWSSQVWQCEAVNLGALDTHEFGVKGHLPFLSSRQSWNSCHVHSISVNPSEPQATAMPATMTPEMMVSVIPAHRLTLPIAQVLRSQFHRLGL